ncbi:CPBP family intramembrane glutamic endopeptidase [Streptococcus sp.]|uniref:CPBP family intramembrane glutamic endopeptidase n=1 Tax=Streptococcus sp. TaxID=1306 RepID=UPI00391B959F
MLIGRLKQVWDKLWIVLRALGLLIVAHLPTLLLDSRSSLVLSNSKDWVFLLTALMAFLVFWFFWWRTEKNNLNIWDPKILSWKGLGIVLLGYVVMFSCESLAQYLMEMRGIDTTANQDAIVQLLAGVPFWLALIITAPLPALAEEIIFRGYLYKKLFGGLSIGGLVLSSLIFGLMHGPTDWLSCFIYSSSGLILGYSYYKTGYLIYPIVIHLLQNGLTTILYYFFT